MTVHMVRVLIEPPKGEAENAVDNWVQNHTEWTDDPVDHSLTETTAGIDGSGTSYVRGDYRFIQDSPATSLLDDLEERIQSLQGGLWYRLGYHNCPHDGTARQIEETHSLEPGASVRLDFPVHESITIGSGGYTEGEDFDVAGRLLNIPEESTLSAGSYTVEYDTKSCSWDESETRDSGTVPSDIPSL